MNLFRLLSGWFGRSLENPKVSLRDPEAWDEFYGIPKTSTGIRVNQRTALLLAAWFRGVNLLASTVAKLPIMVYRVDPDGGKTKDRDHPAYRLLKRKPNADMTAYTLRQVLTSHAIQSGNGYAYIDLETAGRSAGRPRQLIPLLPDRTYPIRENGQLWYTTTIGGTLTNPGSTIVKLDPSEVLHIKGLGYDGLCGYSLIDIGREDIGRATARKTFDGKFFENAATPRIVLEAPGALSDRAWARLKESWGALKAGLTNAHKTAVLEEGVKANALTHTLSDSQMSELQNLDLIDIANRLNLPPHKLGVEARTSFASLEQANQEYLDDSIDPWLVAWETECWDKLLSTFEQDRETHEIEFVRGALLRANLAARASYYRSALAGLPWMTREEVRLLENLNPVPEGTQEFVDPLNMGAGRAADGGDAGGQTPDAGERDVGSAVRTEPDAHPTPVRTEDPTPIDHTATHRRLVAAAVRRMYRRLAAHHNKPDFKPEAHRDVVTECLSDVQPLCRATAPNLADWLLDNFPGPGKFRDVNPLTETDAVEIAENFVGSPILLPTEA